MLQQLKGANYTARKGQIVDASLINAPIQRNSREENALIKKGEKPEDWSNNKTRQKAAGYFPALIGRTSEIKTTFTSYPSNVESRIPLPLWS